MKRTYIVLIGLSLAVSTAVMADRLGDERNAKQAELDAACEAARQTKLVQVRAELVEECVDTKQRADRATCERFYADYGESTGSQVALFYDLPACETALEYRRSYRSSLN